MVPYVFRTNFEILGIKGYDLPFQEPAQGRQVFGLLCCKLYDPPRFIHCQLLCLE